MNINYIIKKRSVLFSCLFMFSVNTTLLMAECNKELVNGWGGKWEPFLMGTYDKPVGLDIEILDAVIVASGCTWRNTELEIPWKRHLNWLRVGELDLATGASWTLERAEYAYFTKSYRSENVALFVRKGDIKKYEQYSLQELANVLTGIGVELGNTYGSEMGTLLEKMGERVQRVNNNRQNIPKLLGGRIDGYLGHLPYDAMQIKKKGHEDEIKILPVSLVNTGDIHFMLSKLSNSEDIFRALEAGLAEIKANGTYDKIIKKYSDKYGISHW